jgi:Protein of unknown function (DUF4240)
MRFLLLLFIFSVPCFNVVIAQPQKPGFVTNEVMDASDFWQIIDRSLKNTDGDANKQKTNLTKILKREDIKDIVRFNNKFFSLMEIAFDTKLQAAADIMHDDCTDECFTGFRAWLIGQGKDVFEKAIVNPESLADVKLKSNQTSVDLQFCADDAFMYLVEDHIPLGLKFSNEPHGRNFPKDQYANFFPKLWEKFK